MAGVTFFSWNNTMWLRKSPERFAEDFACLVELAQQVYEMSLTLGCGKKVKWQKVEDRELSLGILAFLMLQGCDGN